MTELNAGTQHLACNVGVDGAVGYPAPRRVADVVVGKWAVEVAGHHRTGAVGTDDRRGVPCGRVRQRDPHAIGRRHKFPRGKTGVHGAVGQRPGEHLGQGGAADHHQRLAQRLDQPLRRRVPQPAAVVPAQGAGCDPAACVADRVAEPDLIERGQRVGPDADACTRRGVGALLDDGDVLAAALQRHGGRQPGDACPDNKDLLRHPSNVARDPAGLIGRRSAACWWPSRRRPRWHR